MTEVVCVAAPRDESRSESGPSSPPSEPQLSSLVRAVERQTQVMEQLAKSIHELAQSAERTAGACLMLIEAMGQPEEEDVQRNLLGERI